MNEVVLIGRLTKDPDLRYLANESNTAVCRFTLAVDRKLSQEKKQQAEANNQPTADFIPITVFGKQAENAATYLTKGRLVAIAGRIQTGSYEKEGRRIYTTEVIANSVQFLEWNNRDKTDKTDEIEGFYQISNEDIPF